MRVLTEVAQDALELGLADRARLADILLESLQLDRDPHQWDEIDREMERRMAAREKGDVSIVDGDEVLQRAWQRLQS